MIRRLRSCSEDELRGLSQVLIDAVAGGASVGFMHPLSASKAGRFWRSVAEAVDRGERALLVAEDADGIIATVQLLLEQPENQPHRADVAKMLVHRRARRLGIGAALMGAVESVAHECGKSLLVLDTVTGGDAERLYQRLGWRRVGVIPGFALWPDGRLCDTTIFYRNIPDG